MTAEDCAEPRRVLEELLAAVDQLPVDQLGEHRPELFDAARAARQVLGQEPGEARSAWRAGYESGIGEGRKAASTEKMLGRYRVFDPRPLQDALGALDTSSSTSQAAHERRVVQAARDILEAAFPPEWASRPPVAP